MNEPRSTDAILGGNSRSSSDAVLGGIEGARQRWASAKTPDERWAAITELRKYDPEEARLATQKLFSISLSFPEIQSTVLAIEKAQKALQDIASSPKFQAQIAQVNESFIQGGVALAESFVRVLKNVSLPTASYVNSTELTEIRSPIAILKEQHDEFIANLHNATTTNSQQQDDIKPDVQKAKKQKSPYLQGVEKIISKGKQKRF
jgi:hypothetical protein